MTEPWELARELVRIDTAIWVPAYAAVWSVLVYVFMLLALPGVRSPVRAVIHMFPSALALIWAAVSGFVLMGGVAHHVTVTLILADDFPTALGVAPWRYWIAGALSVVSLLYVFLLAPRRSGHLLLVPALWARERLPVRRPSQTVNDVLQMSDRPLFRALSADDIILRSAIVVLWAAEWGLLLARCRYAM